MFTAEMKNYQKENLIVEGARIMFRNFAGNQTKFNQAGKRNFCVEITDPAIAGALLEDGWNVRTLSPREGEDDERYYIAVNVSFENKPPKIIIVGRNKQQTNLTEETVGMLDNADIANIDLIIRPYNWEMSGRQGVKGYLKTAYVTLEEDEFADKYRPDDEEDDLPF